MPQPCMLPPSTAFTCYPQESEHWDEMDQTTSYMGERHEGGNKQVLTMMSTQFISYVSFWHLHYHNVHVQYLESIGSI